MQLIRITTSWNMLGENWNTEPVWEFCIECENWLQEKRISLLYNLSCDERDDKCASLSLLLVFLYSVECCQIWNSLRIQPVLHLCWANEICGRGLVWLQSSTEGFFSIRNVIKRCFLYTSKLISISKYTEIMREMLRGVYKWGIQIFLHFCQTGTF